jgi:hypothetical protein
MLGVSVHITEAQLALHRQPICTSVVLHGSWLPATPHVQCPLMTVAAPRDCMHGRGGGR